MNTKQKRALECAVLGHNLLILGAAGTGKSFVLNTIAHAIRQMGRKVQLTCSTGIATALYRQSDATVCTIHKFLGLLDGRHDPDEIGAVITNTPAMSYVVDNIKSVDCIIIDECSMLSARSLEAIQAVCQLKNRNEKFGGIQLILCGDFFQLPPVANLLYQDNGEFCFMSKSFMECFLHRVVLEQNMRRENGEHLLDKAVAEVYSGSVSPQTEEFICRLARPLSVDNNNNTIKLFATNNRVDDFNRKCLLKHPGTMYEFKSSDSGKAQHLYRISAPAVIWLKVGCPVILLQNISDKLVNGLRGHIHSITTDGPVVYFHDLNLLSLIPKVKFSGNIIIVLTTVHYFFNICFITFEYYFKLLFSHCKFNANTVSLYIHVYCVNALCTVLKYNMVELCLHQAATP